MRHVICKALSIVNLNKFVTALLIGIKAIERNNGGWSTPEYNRLTRPNLK